MVGERENSVIQQALDGGKLMADMSADERFYNRSVRIRKKIAKWLFDHIDWSYDTLGEMEAEAANYAGCSMACSRRWIFQYTRSTKPWRIEEREDSYVIRARPSKE